MTDSSAGSDRLKEFLQGSDERRALLLGAVDERVRVVPGPKPTAVRAALGITAQELGLR